LSDVPLGDTSENGNTLALVSLTTGIFALIGSGCCCVPYLNMLAMMAYPLTLILTVTALVTGYLGFKKSKQAGEASGIPMAIIGMVASGIGLLLVAIELALTGLSVVALTVLAIIGQL
jgi:hypothetical protein